jgi:signal transduction histidine kinase
VHTEAPFIPYFDKLAEAGVEDGDAWLARTHPDAALARAWRWRQLAPQRAKALLAALAQAPLGEVAQARIRLMQAEWAYLHGDLTGATAAAQALHRWAEPADEPAFKADLCLLERLLCNARGEAVQAQAWVLQAQRHAERAGDPVRTHVALLFVVFEDTLKDAKASEQQWGPTLEHLRRADEPEVSASLAVMTQGVLDYCQGRPDRAALALAEAFDKLVATGQALTAVVCAGNVASAFEDMLDPEAALNWAQRGLELARAIGFPVPLGLALYRVAERLRGLGRLDVALCQLQEAQRLLQPFKEGRNHILVLIELGHVAVARQDFAAARDHYETALRLATPLAAVDVLATAWQGMAQAGLGAGDLDAAEAAAGQALALAQRLDRPVRQAEALMALARCKVQRGLPDAALLPLRAAIGCYQGKQAVPAAWWGELAACLAALGQHAQAYDAQLQAQATLQTEGQERAQRHAMALQLRMQTAQLQADAEAQRQRAELLLAASQTLTHLGEVGQELTALLDEERIYAAIHRHLGPLLQAEFFSVYLLEQAPPVLRRVFAVHGDHRFETGSVPLDHPQSAVARCLREQRAFQLAVEPGDPHLLWLTGSEPIRAALFAPLRMGERSLGVMSIQSLRADAFAERELQVFRTLCAYASIAIGNAQAYRLLAQTQRGLARQQRLATVSAMVAGMAHEMNTPIGNAVLAASTMVQTGGSIEQAVAVGAVGRRQLARFVQDVQEGGQLVMRNLQRAHALLLSFKQVVQEPRTLTRSVFALRPEVELALERVARRAQAAGHRLEIDMPPDLSVEAYREPFGDLLQHWADNALAHGLRPDRPGCLRVSASLQPDGRVHLQLSDDGVGMDADVLERAFEPFFSTRLGAHHSGLGLTVVHAIAVDVFGGELRLESQPERHTTLHWTFPRVAPSP